MNTPDLLFTLSFFALSFLILRPLILIGFRQKKWIQGYFHYQRQQAALYAALPHLLLQLSSFLKSGYAFPQALETIAQSPQGRALYRLLKTDRENHGHPRTVPLLMTFLKSTIQLSQRNGIALSAMLNRIAALTRDQRQFEEKLNVLTFPSKVQAAVAILLPWFVLAIFASIDPHLISNALTHWAGRVGFSTAFLMELAALLWIKRILK